MQDDQDRDGQGRRASAPEAVWAAVRQDYLAGVSAAECARRHGVGRTALRTRAARQGWRRMDQPWIPPNTLDADDEGVELDQSVDGDLDRIDPAELSFVAHRRMMRAVLRGDAVAAMRWRRVRLAMDEEQAEIERLYWQDELARANRGPQADDADHADPVFSDPPRDA